MKIYGAEDTPLAQCINSILNHWMIIWDKGLDDEAISFMAETFDHKPSLQEVKDVILGWYNTNTNKEILSGFKWKDIPVWLSMENQFNYKASYDIAVQSNGEILPTFKLGDTSSPVYYIFESLEELKDFYTSAIHYVQSTLSAGWKKKDSIDWKAYNDLLEL